MRLIPLLLLIGAVNCKSNSSFDSSTCGIEKACFLPTNANCYMGCNGMGFSYVFTDDTYNFMKIEIFGKITSSMGFYYAVGFSLDIMMGDDHVIECSSLGGADPSLKFSYNVNNFDGTNEPSNIRIPNQDNYAGYFLNSTITKNDGMIYCSATVKVSGAADSSEVFKFNKTQPNYYLLMANGPTNNAGLLHHVHDVTTPLSVNLLDVHPAFDPNGCGVTKGCYIPTPDECYLPNIQPLDMVVSYYMLDETHLQLEILGTAPSGSGSYIAVGFSLDNKMGNESVIECSQYGTNPLSTKFSYNNGTPENIRIVNETIIRPNYIKDQNAYQDGKLYCIATILVDGSSGNSQIFKYDKNQAYYLLLAKGNTSTTGLTHHTTACVPKLPVKLSQLERNFDATTCNTATKTCFLPTECYMGCNGMGFSFKMINASTMKIEIFSVSTSLGYYVAVGFSTDNQMGDESVIECSSINNGNYSVKFSYNIGGDNRYNTRITGESDIRSQYITNEVISFKDGSLYCSATVKVSGYTDNPQIFTYDPNKNYYLLMASGTTSATGLTKHFDHVVSDSPYDLAAGTNVSSTAASFDCSACGQTKGCYFPDDAFTCNGYGVSYRYISDSILEMELTKKGIDGYVAVGFSDDNMMGNDYVIECSNLGGAELSWKFSYNDNSPKNVRITNETQIEGTYFSDVYVTVANGEIYCYAKVNVAGWAGSDQVFKYSSGMQYFLLMAQGPTTGQGLSPHTDKMASYLSYDLKQVTGIPPTTTQSPPNLNFDCSQCNQTKGCFFPYGTANCTGMGFAWQYISASSIRMEIMKPDVMGYVAVGFNVNKTMYNSNVVECSMLPNETSPSMKFSYNNWEPRNVRIQGIDNVQNTYFTAETDSINDGIMYCNGIVNVSGVAGNNEVFRFDPTQLYHILLAVGQTNASGLLQHTQTGITGNAVNLTVISAVQNPTPSPNTDFNCSQCGQTKTCFFPRNQNSCEGMGVAIQYLNATTLSIELMKSETGGYVAVGFNPSAAQMPNSYVIECSQMSNQNSPTFKFSYNNPTNVRIANEAQIEGTYFSDQTIKSANGATYCKSTVNVGGWSGSDQVFKFDPSQEYYLMVAIGPTSGSVLAKHYDREVGSSKVDLKQVTGIPPTTTQPPPNLNFDCSQCNQTKGCFFPYGTANCTGMGFAWQYISASSIRMEIMKPDVMGYVAVGFNVNKTMYNSNVVECSMLPNETSPSMKFSYNNWEPRNVRIQGIDNVQNTYFTAETDSINDGIMYCNGIVNVSGVAGNNEVFRFDPTQLYHILLAVGQTNASGLLQHTQTGITGNAVNLTVISAVQNPTPSPNTDFNCSQCGQTKTCFFPRYQNSCEGMGVAIQYLNATTLSIELMKSETGGYVAVGFNPSAAQMPNSYVIECSQMSNQNSPTFKFSYNNPTNVRIANEAQIEGTYFSDQTIKSANGATYCKSTVNVGGWSGSDQVFKFDPSQEYYLMVAIGPTSGSVLAKHSDREVGSSKVDLTIAGLVSSKGGLSPIVIARLIKAHAVMMILAWICFVPTALLFARFLRTSWPLIKPGGLLIWFHVHRTCNFLGIALMIASFVCIMTANSWKWSGPPHGEKWASVHTMCGLFALIFAWAQPFISFMRCQPNTPNRPFFNWTHRLVGVVAYGLATTALSVAASKFDLGSSWTNSNLQLGLVLCPVSLMAFLVILFLILDYYQDKEHNHGSVEMIRQVVVLVSVGLMVGDAIALSIMVCV